MKELLHPEPFESDNAAPVRRDTRYPRATRRTLNGANSANEPQRPPGALKSSMGPPGGVFMAKDTGRVNDHR
jgi:hypothetical protein